MDVLAVYNRPDCMAFTRLVIALDWVGIREWHIKNTPWLSDSHISIYIEDYKKLVTLIDLKQPIGVTSLDKSSLALTVTTQPPVQTNGSTGFM